MSRPGAEQPKPSRCYRYSDSERHDLPALRQKVTEREEQLMDLLIEEVISGFGPGQALHLVDAIGPG